MQTAKPAGRRPLDGRVRRRDVGGHEPSVHEASTGQYGLRLGRESGNHTIARSDQARSIDVEHDIACKQNHQEALRVGSEDSHEAKLSARADEQSSKDRSCGHLRMAYACGAAGEEAEGARLKRIRGLYGR